MLKNSDKKRKLYSYSILHSAVDGRKIKKIYNVTFHDLSNALIFQFFAQFIVLGVDYQQVVTVNVWYNNLFQIY